MLQLEKEFQRRALEESEQDDDDTEGKVMRQKIAGCQNKFSKKILCNFFLEGESDSHSLRPSAFGYRSANPNPIVAIEARDAGFDFEARRSDKQQQPASPTAARAGSSAPTGAGF